MLSCEGTGKNIEQAIENALFELKATREDVDIKILNPGGFLKKAKVLVTIADDAKEKYERKEKLKEAERKEEVKNEETSVLKVEKKEEKKEEKQEERKVQIVTDEEYVVKESKKECEEKKVEAEKLLQDILNALNLQAEITKTEDEKFVRYNLSGENLNDLIGHHGECLFALTSYVNSACRNHKKVVLDVENYRVRREETLKSLAERIANKVAKSGRYYKFEPMDPSERRIIHLALQNDERVTTMSKGEEPRRYLIVFPREYKE